MKWIAKAVLQKVLSWCPEGESLNYFFQRRITRQYPRSREDFLHWVDIGVEHFDLFCRYGHAKSLSEVVFYEFGAGWDLIIPLTYYALGVEHQTLIDICPHLRFELVNDALRRFATHKVELERRLQRPLRPLGTKPVMRISDIRERFGITYLAPLDARDTGLPSESFSFISSTATFEHIPAPHVFQILVECERLLKRGEIMSFRIDMVDHFAYFDSTISAYHFLKFSDATWALVNNRLMYTNRLRHSDYKQLFAKAGLATVEERPELPTAANLEVLGALKPASKFSSYSLEDLGTKRLQVTLRKQPAGRAGESAGHRSI